MGFASDYLDKRVLFPEIVPEAPDENTCIIVVIPAYNEPGICKVLDSLSLCYEPDCKTEVIIIVNAPENASLESIENNKLTLQNIESWKRINTDCFFRLFSFMASNKEISGWGVGLARKTGMDEAVRRFNSINKPEGIILNLDADCLVEKNYIKSVYNEFLKKKERSACSVYFEHPLSGDDFPPDIYRYITLYELHLRYYYQALAFCRFPYVFHTVGSAVAVKADAYVKAGGMNRRQAGEDFYFIQKLLPAGGYFNLNTTTVYPSPRPSFRVPFGTGASIEKLKGEESTMLYSYNLHAFIELRTLFSDIEKIFECAPERLIEFYMSLPEGVKAFTGQQDWVTKMLEIKNNTSGLTSFTKRFFEWFNMFRIVKYLNYVHQGIFNKRPVNISASELLERMDVNINSEDPYELLLHYRKLEKAT
jgi:hypothetical protein